MELDLNSVIFLPFLKYFLLYLPLQFNEHFNTLNHSIILLSLRIKVKYISFLKAQIKVHHNLFLHITLVL